MITYNEFIHGSFILFKNENDDEEFKKLLIENNLEYIYLLSDYLKINELNRKLNQTYKPENLDGKEILNKLRLLKNLKTL